MNLLQDFKDKPFIEAVQSFFKKLNVPVNEITTAPATAIDIIGENNIGKSTLFEAIHLWMLGYNSLIQANGKNFYGRNTPRYIPFDRLYFLRMTTIDDVFHTHRKTASITINILLEEFCASNFLIASCLFLTKINIFIVLFDALCFSIKAHNLPISYSAISFSSLKYFTEIKYNSSSPVFMPLIPYF